MGQLCGGVDIRELGSHNAGGTNALRTQGKVFALWVMLIDVGKGVIPVLLLPALAIPGVGLDAQVSRALITYAVGFGTILGHVYPLWYAFRGGKGGATSAGVLFALAPWLALPAIGIWFAVIVVTRYVGLATMSVVIGVSAYIGLTRLPEEYGLFIFSLFAAALILYTHRANIKRMLEGNENRTEVVRFFR